MTSHEFCLWLRGYLDALSCEGCDGLSDSEVSVIDSRLDTILKGPVVAPPPLRPQRQEPYWGPPFTITSRTAQDFQDRHSEQFKDK